MCVRCPEGTVKPGNGNSIDLCVTMACDDVITVPNSQNTGCGECNEDLFYLTGRASYARNTVL